MTASRTFLIEKKDGETIHVQVVSMGKTHVYYVGEDALPDSMPIEDVRCLRMPSDFDLSQSH